MSVMYKLERKLPVGDFNSVSDEDNEENERSSTMLMTPRTRDEFWRNCRIVICGSSAGLLLLLNLIGAAGFWVKMNCAPNWRTVGDFGHFECIGVVSRKFGNEEMVSKRILLEEMDQCLRGCSKINTFPRALFYSWTIYSTVGYGNLYPHTVAGRIATVIYSITVVPIYIAFKFEFGTYLANFLFFLTSRIVGIKEEFLEFLWRKKTENRISKDRLILFSSIILCTACLLISSAIFAFFEKINYFSAIYFGIITMTLVGIGDITPTNCIQFMASYLGFFLILDVLSNHIFYFLQAKIRMFFHFLARKMLKPSSNLEKEVPTIQNVPIITTQCMPMNVLNCERAEIEKDARNIQPLSETLSTAKSKLSETFIE